MQMNDISSGLATILAIGLLIGLWLAVGYVRRLRSQFTIFDYENGLLYRHGNFLQVLKGGRHVRWGLGYTMTPVDMRLQMETVGNQEVLTKDGLAVKLYATVAYSVADARTAVEGVQSFQTAAYLSVQLAIRDSVTGRTGDELLEQRALIGDEATETCRAQFHALGLKLDRVDVRDVTFPGDLKKAFAQVVLAQKESQAVLERARGESAALRSLANAAKMLENNPALLQLRTLQALSEAKGATVVLNMGDSNLSPLPLAAESQA
jgi:regulator of protease activity HflC (stomatin/prohibitin superfamily)